MNLPSGDPARTGSFPGPGVGSRPAVRGRLAPSGARPSLPTVVGGTAFLGDDKGGVFAVDLADGGVRWRYRHELFHADGEPARSSVAALPAVSGDLVFVEAGGQTFAHDRRTGELRWRVPEISGSHPVVADDLLLVMHDIDGAGAYDVTTGEKRWDAGSADGLDFGLLVTYPVVAGGRMFLAEGVEGNHTHGGLHAVDLKTGVSGWGRREETVPCDLADCDGNELMFGPWHPVYARGLVWATRSRYCDSGNPATMELVGFDPADGTERVLLAEPGGGALGDVFFAAPVFGDDLTYCTAGPRVHALDPSDGHLVWSHDVGARVVGTPLYAGHLLHVAVEGGRLHGLDARTGDPRWEFAPDAPTRWSAEVESQYGEPAAPITLAGGVLYVETDDGVLALS